MLTSFFPGEGCALLYSFAAVEVGQQRNQLRGRDTLEGHLRCIVLAIKGVAANSIVGNASYYDTEGCNEDVMSIADVGVTAASKVTNARYCSDDGCNDYGVNIVSDSSGRERGLG